MADGELGERLVLRETVDDIEDEATRDGALVILARVLTKIDSDEKSTFFKGSYIEGPLGQSSAPSWLCEYYGVAKGSTARWS